MTQTVLDSSTPQQPDTLIAVPATTVNEAAHHQADTHHQAPAPRAVTNTIRYNTVVPETLLRPHDSIFNPTIDTTEYLMLCNDSLFAKYEGLAPRHRKSMFATNTHTTAEPQTLAHRTETSSDWIFGTIIILLTLISIYINSQKFKIKDIFLSVFDTRVLERVFRENNIRTASLLPMEGIYLASLALIILKSTQTLGHFVISLPQPLFFGITLAALIAFILLKNSFIRLLGNIFDDRAATMLYISSNNLFYFIGGLTTTPLLLLLFYISGAQDTLLKTTLIIIAIVFTIRLLRGMQLILTNSKTSKLYLFYYLCILEIIPILVMAKVILL